MDRVGELPTGRQQPPQYETREFVGGLLADGVSAGQSWMVGPSMSSGRFAFWVVTSTTFFPGQATLSE